MLDEVNVYIDESGNTDIFTEKEGASDFYALTAVVIPVGKVETMAEQVIRLTQGVEIKSSKIRRARRAKWIQKISELEFTYHVLIVDKSKIRRSSGLGYKKSFFKFFSRKMYERLERAHNIANIYSDEYGTESFMRECESYYKSNVQKPIFEYINVPGIKKMSFNRVKSHECHLVQLADLICGTTRRVVEGKDSPEILDPIKKYRLAFNVWPPTRRDMGRVFGGGEFDELVQAVSYSEAVRFIENSMDSFDEMEILASLVLSYLLDKYLENPESYHFSAKIRQHLVDAEGFEVNDYKFKQIIAYIRSTGVPIASSRDGYKIPNNANDIESFVKKVQSTVDPYLRRLGNVRSLLFESSKGRWDILDDETLRPFRKYLDA